jgi:hypothetical protein
MEGPKSVGDSEGDLFAPPLPFCLAVAHTYKDIYVWHCEVGLALAALRIIGVLRFSDLLMRRVSRRTRRCRDDSGGLNGLLNISVYLHLEFTILLGFLGSGSLLLLRGLVAMVKRHCVY